MSRTPVGDRPDVNGADERVSRATRHHREAASSDDAPTAGGGAATAEIAFPEPGPGSAATGETAVAAALVAQIAENETRDAGVSGETRNDANPDSGGEERRSDAAGSDLQDLNTIGQGGFTQSLSNSGHTPPPLGLTNDETSRHGRDGLKHGEMGSAGHGVQTPLGSGLDHLTGLGDESIGRRNGEQLSTSENREFPGEEVGVGIGLDHLWILGDTEYYRASDDDDLDAVPSAFAAASFSGVHLVAQPPRLSGKGETPEDVPTHLKLDIALAQPGGETVREVRIAAPPAGTVIDWDHALPGLVTVAPNGDIVITGSTSQIKALTNSVSILPPDDFSGTLTLGITVTVSGYGTTASAHLDYAITVIPVADVPDVTGDDQTTLEDHPVLLPNLAGNLNDLDGSEVLGFQIRGVPPGASFKSGHVDPTDSTVWIFSPGEIAAGVVFVPPTNSTDTASMTIRAIATEQANGDTAYAEAPVVVHITPLNGPKITLTAIDTNEDAQVALGAHITLGDHDPDGSERLDGVTVTNLPAGSAISITPAVGVQVVMNDPLSPTGFTIAADPLLPPLSPADLEQAIKDTLATLKVTPPLNSDADMNVSITVTSHDATTGSDFTAQATMNVPVHAVADQPSGSGSGAGSEDAWIAVPITVAPTDTDGSETLTYVEIAGVPATASLRWLNPDNSPNTSGSVSIDPVTNVIRITGTTAEIEARAHALQILPAADTDDDMSLTVKVGSAETHPTEAGDVAQLTSELTFSVPVSVLPVADAVTLPSSSTAVEDHAASVGAAIEAGLVKADQNSLQTGGTSSETITAIVISGIPTSGVQAIAAISYPGDGTIAAQPHVTVTYDVALGTLTLQLQAGGTEQDVRDALKLVTLTPHVNTDADILLSVAVTTVDRWGTADASTPLATTLPHTLVVTADATNDQPIVSGAASGIEDTTFALPVTVTMQDTDGSETLAKVKLTGIPHGAAVSWTGLPAGASATAIIDAASGDTTGWVFRPASTSYSDTQALQSFLSSKLTITPPQDSGADFDLTVRAYNVESNLSGLGGSTSTTPFGQGSIHVAVVPALDPVTLPATSSSVDEDRWVKVDEDGTGATLDQPSVGFGGIIEAAMARSGDKGLFDAADTSEGIGRVVLSNLPKDTVSFTALLSTDPVRVDVAEDAVTHIQTYTIEANPAYSGATLSAAELEAAIRSTLDTFRFTPAPDDSRDVTVNVAVYTQDTDPDLAASSIPLTFSASSTHTIVVNARADTPTVQGDTVTTYEDTSVALNLDAALRDHVGTTEVLSVVVSGVPQGASLSFTGAAVIAVATNPATGVSTYTLTGAETDIRDTLAHTTFNPTPQWSGTVDMTIAATAREVGADDLNAFAEPTADDIVSVSAAIVVTITPVVDDVTFTNASTIVQENAGNQAADAVLTIDLGQRLGATMADLDGSQSLSLTLTGIRPDFAASFGSSIAGVTTDVSTPGQVTISGTNSADVLSVLGTLKLTSTSDSDADFVVHVSGSTNENALAPGAAHAISFDHTVIVQSVADTPALDAGAATKPFVAEDSAWVTYPVTVSLNDSDGSESYKSIVVTFASSGSGTQPSVQFDPAHAAEFSGVTFDTSVGGRVTLTGPTAAIEAALSNLQVKPGAHNDADITVTVTAVAVESNPTEPNSTGPGNAGDEIAMPTASIVASFVVPVSAVADTPSLSIDGIGAGGAGFGLEDNDIPLKLTAGHADTADGSETIRDVVIGGVPAGFTLTSTGSGSLNYDVVTGNYTVTGASDAAINDTLAKLKLVIAPAGPRLNLDTDFQLQVTVTTIENHASETGAGQGVNDTSSVTFPVSVPVHAVADGVTPSGSSTIVEDVAKVIGTDIHWTLKDTDGTENVTQIVVTGFAAGSTVTYTDALGAHTVAIGSTSDLITFTASHTTDGSNPIRVYLDTLSITAPPNSDADMTLTVALTTTDNDGSTKLDSYSHAVTVQAVADTPSLAVSDISATEDSATAYALVIHPARSSDQDGSETLSVLVKLPGGGSPLQSITPQAVHDTSHDLSVSGPVVVAGHNVYTVTGTSGGAAITPVTITDNGNGTYTVAGATVTNATTSTSSAAAIDAVLGAGVLTLNVQSQWSGSLSGTSAITVQAISTEAATGGQLAANSYGGADNTSKTETVTQYIGVTITPQVDVPTFSTSSSTYSENNGSTNDSQQLVVPLGTDLNLTFADTDGSQSMTVTLAGIPTSAADGATILFGATTVATGIDNSASPTVISTATGPVTITTAADGSITIDGANSIGVIDVIKSLTVRIASDSDKDFTVDISGSTTEALGGTATFGGSGSPITHPVIIKAVADEPGVDVHGTTKPAILEDSDWASYPVTVSLNDGDGSESLQSVVVKLQTAGAGAAPQVQLDPAHAADYAGVTAVIAGAEITLTGATDRIIAALGYLQVKPGADNGENIVATVTATAVESAPTEANDNGPGVAGSEISIPTATTVATFTIPVTPVPDDSVLTVPASANGTEDIKTALAGISFTTNTDTDGSESRYVDFKTSSFPAGTVFSAASGTVGTTVTDSGTGETWVRIPESALSTLKLLTPHDWSGTFSIDVRGVIVDRSASQGVDVTTTTAVQTFDVEIAPIADPALQGVASVGNEDTVIAFGADLADLAHANHAQGVHVEDTTVGATGAGGIETIAKIVLEIPADTPSLQYAISYGTDVGTAHIAVSGNTYTITSSIITGAADLGALTDTERATAEADIRAALATFGVQMGPTDIDRNGVIKVTATTLDVKDGTPSTTDATFNHTVSVLAVADQPAIDAGFTVAGAENTPFALVGSGGETLVAHRSQDHDGSEVLSVEISNVPFGTSIGLAGTFTLPSGAALTNAGGGVWRITGASETDINSVLANLTFAAGDFAGAATLTVTAITTEQGQAGDPDTYGLGAGIAVKTATAVGTITVEVSPQVDTPSVKGNAVGLEDTLIPVPIAVSLGDKDPTYGVETYVMKIADDLPAGTKLYGASGEITASGGFYTLTPADVDVLQIQPPHDHSSSLQGDIVLHTTTIVTDTATTGTDQASFTNSITVHVAGVADTPASHPVTVTALEDQPIALGNAVLSAAGGSLAGVLSDADGSEHLSFVIGGLPAGVLPTTSAGRLDYIGNGTWSISADDVATLTTALQSLTLPAKPNFSGDNPWGSLTVTAVSQEIDSSQSTSAPWPVTIHVAPTLDPGLAIDGLAGWSPGVTQPEDATSAGLTTGLSLASATSKTYVDDDGSEKVHQYDFDLTKMFAAGDAAHNAGIDARCAALYGDATAWNTLSDAAKAQWFIDTFAQGTFTSHTSDASVALGHIVVTEAQLDANAQAIDIVLAGGLTTGDSPFLDSNVDFAFALTASIRDTAVISGLTTTITGTQSTDFHVSLQGVADVPAVFASNPDHDGDASNVDAFAPASLIPLDMGGDTVDTDTSLGRTQSETVYYVLSIDGATNSSGATAPPTFALVDGAGNPVGLDNGDNTWLIRASDVAIDPATGALLGINLESAWYSGGKVTVTASLTTVVVENDTGNLVTNSTGSSFSFIVDPSLGGGAAGTAPAAPTIDMTKLLAGVEDTASPAAAAGFVTAGANTASVAVMFDLPAGATISNASYNPTTGRWVATMADVNNGLVKITPPHDFSGVLDIPVEAVATGTNLLRSSTSAIMHMPVTPVADGPSSTAAPAAGLEDTAVALNLALAASPTGSAADQGEIDTDGSETLGAFAYVKADHGATVQGGLSIVAAGDADAMIDGQSLVGWTRVAIAQLSSVTLMPAANWHGTVNVSVAAATTDELSYTDPATGTPVTVSDTRIGSHSFAISITAIADAPLLSVPDAAHSPAGAEDHAILLTGLSAALADTVTENGGEILSVKISGVPSGTTFSDGSNNGDGSWTIPADKLATLSLTPPLDFSGTMHLTLEGYAIETSNADIAHATASFDVTVTPVADSFEVLAKDVSLGSSGLASLSLNVRMSDDNALTDTSGNTLNAGETLPELVEITFTGVPAGTILVPSSGGELTSPTSGTWVFTGTEAQANALQIAASVGATAGTSTINISAVSIDGADHLATPVTDSFRLTMTAPTNAGLAYTGTTGADIQDWSAHLGNDVMKGLAGNDLLTAGSGINIVEGGSGSDTMTGGSGATTYLWQAGDDAGGAVDTITNFHLGVGKDHLDLSRLLSGFDQQTSNIDDFVHIKADGKTIQIDQTGSGASFHDVVVLQGAALSQSDLHAMVKNGNLIV